jgi:L-arabinonolactonase
LITGQDGLYNVDFATGAIEFAMPAKHDPRKLRFNDGRTDRQGRLWVSTVSENLDLSNTDAHGWFRLDKNGFEEMIFAAGVPNGTAFSPGGKTMYRARTMERQIFAYDYDTSAGLISNERIFATVPYELGAPDGATVDTEGGYWVALAAPQDGSSPTGGVARFTPDGEMDRYIEMPVPMVTMVAFGGPDLSTLYVTTARLEKFMHGAVPPHAGDIFVIETDYRGEPETPFSVF